MIASKAYRSRLTFASILFVSLALLFGVSLNAQAQCPVSTPSPQATPTNSSKTSEDNTDKTKPETETAKPAPSPTPFTLSIKSVSGPDSKVPGVAGLGDRITVEVKCLKEELARQEKPENGVPAEQRIDPKTFVLFMNDVEISKLHPSKVYDDKLEFQLKRDPDSRNAWQNFLARPTSDTIPVNVTVGPEGKAPLGGAQPFRLRIYYRPLLYLGVVLFLATFIGFLIAAAKTTIIRDSGPPNPTGGPLTRPYSLARTQASWWFFIILGSFLFIGLVTWDLDTITSSSLILMGIGTGTALGAAMVDANKRESSTNELETLKPRETKLVASIEELKAKIAQAGNIALGGDPNLASTIATQRTELATLQAELEQVRSQVNDAASGLEKPVSEGPIMDFLSDVNGVTFHRFQMLVWTIVLGLIFIYSVWTNLTMPQFSDTLLALMGISAGTYIGFKIPEKQTDARDVTDMSNLTAGSLSNNADTTADTEPHTEEEGC